MIHPRKLRPLFLVKLIVTPIAALTTMAWCVPKAGAASSIFSYQATLTDSAKEWDFLKSMSSICGNLSTLACIISGLSRHARSTKGEYVQLPVIPCIFTLGTLVGIIGSSATAVIYGDLIWNPPTINTHWIGTGSHSGRAPTFFCGLAWMISQMSSNITAEFYFGCK